MKRNKQTLAFASQARTLSISFAKKKHETNNNNNTERIKLLLFIMEGKLTLADLIQSIAYNSVVVFFFILSYYFRLYIRLHFILYERT